MVQKIERERVTRAIGDGWAMVVTEKGEAYLGKYSPDNKR